MSVGIFQEQYTVQSSDLDPVYKHLHHAKLLLFLEKARLSFLATIGFSSDSLIAQGLFPVISSINIRYLREVGEGALTVTCEQGRIDGREIVIPQKAFNGKGKVAAEAEVSSMLLSGALKRGVAPPSEFIEAYRRYFSGKLI